MERSIVPVPSEQPQLNERERFAFAKHLEKQDHPVSPATAVKLFELFLAGKTCEDIRRLNPNFTLGQIVHARIEHEWDRQLQEHVDNLYKSARMRLQQVTMETALTISNLLAAKNKLYQDRVLKFLQTGDEEHIKDIGLGGIDGYRKLVEVLQKLTGADQTKTVKGEITHHVTSELPTNRAPTAEQAAEVVEALLAETQQS